MDQEFLNVEIINEQLEKNTYHVIRRAEDRYRSQLSTLASQIIERGDIKIVLLAGPSCAGKTTSAKLLKGVLEERGYHVVTVSMDDFFLNREDTPILPNGMKDYDSVRSLNLVQMEECFSTLWEQKKAWFPIYDFKTGINHAHKKFLKIDENTIIIFEGLHVINPELTCHLGTTAFFKVYASTISGFVYQDQYMDARQLRLVRRMVRDVDRRGNSPETTLQTWTNVCAGEDLYIAPYKDQCDFMINTTHTYELALYREKFLEFMDNHEIVSKDLPFVEMIRASVEIDKKLLPDTTLMWEFVSKD